VRVALDEPPLAHDGTRLIAGLSCRYTAGTAQGIPAQWQRLSLYHAAALPCAAQAEAPDQTMAPREQALKTPAPAALAKHTGDDYAIPGIRAVFVMAPGSLHALGTPVSILLGDADTVAPPPSNGKLAATLLSHATLTALPGAGHYDFLADCTARGRQQEPPCQHIRVPQQRTHATAIATAEAFFDSHL
jgi:pimeloyl-ACP methyl ester carboxylesterase